MPDSPPPHPDHHTVLCLTHAGGAQGWVDRSYPGARFAEAGVRYVTVCGRTVRGHREFPRQRKGPRIPEEYAYDSYTEVGALGSRQSWGRGTGVMALQHRGKR